MGSLDGCERDTLWADRNSEPKGYLFLDSRFSSLYIALSLDGRG
jgi:hypothetical protein